ncbi:MAG: helix-turn-helix transcriptional regulator [Methylococcales bacterium]|nr:helix-turn-helix transcriptional regulator [Methylococcales bacterium]MDD5754719.1 helix-turn-helix transcriptional regulator [Methylococcales bacterium]
MTNDKQLDYLIGVLYEAVLDSSRWHEAVGLCGKYAGGCDAYLLTIDKKLNIPIESVLAATTFPMKSSDDYVNHYSDIDPWMGVLRGSVVDEWRCCHHAHDQKFVDNDEFYQDFLIPYGIRYSMYAWIDNSEDDCKTLGVLRALGQQPFDNVEQLAAQRFSSHFQRALRLQKHTQNLQTKVELGATAIDALALAMLIVDAKGTILHLNIGAERLLNNHAGGLSVKTGCLYASSPVDKDKFQKSIVAATSYPATGNAIRLSCEETRQVFITPLPAASPFAKDFQTPLALVLVMEAGENLSMLQLLGKLYDLSPTELRIVSALLSGKSPEEYAQAAGVTMNTVRTQLKNLFSKTGTRKQSELIAILSKVPPLQN